MADDDSTEIIALASEGIAAGINPLGAELHYLRDAAGHDLLWDGDPAVWKGRAPILFPIIGALAGGHYALDDPAKVYALPRHGFARRMAFSLVEQTPDSALFRLDADDTTRATYPFDFRLDMHFTLAAGAITIVATVSNLGSAPMPASFGFHPAFRWPLPYGEPRADHRILFAAPEPAPIRRLDAEGLIAPDAFPSPIVGDTLVLDDALFADDAIILDPFASRSVRYGAPNGPQLRLDFPAMPQLGIWTKPGAGFICIEPWQGTADLAGATGNIFAKHGVVTIAAGASRAFALSIAIET